MKLYCLEYDSKIQLVASPVGIQSFVQWALKRQPVPIDSAPAADAPTQLPDFVHANLSGLVYSQRAASVLRAEDLGPSTEMAIAGFDGYRIGVIPFGAEDYFAKRGYEFEQPLRAKVALAQIPSGLMSTGGQFTGVAGSFLASEDLWKKLQAAGLTGLHCAAVYELAEN